MILKCRTVAKKLETHSAFELMMEITLWTDLHTTKQWGIMHKLSPAHIRCLPPLVCNRHFTRLIARVGFKLHRNKEFLWHHLIFFWVGTWTKIHTYSLTYVHFGTKKSVLRKIHISGTVLMGQQTLHKTHTRVDFKLLCTQLFCTWIAMVYEIELSRVRQLTKFDT